MVTTGPPGTSPCPFWRWRWARLFIFLKSHSWNDCSSPFLLCPSYRTVRQGSLRVNQASQEVPSENEDLVTITVGGEISGSGSSLGCKYLWKLASSLQMCALYRPIFCIICELFTAIMQRKVKYSLEFSDTHY